MPPRPQLKSLTQIHDPIFQSYQSKIDSQEEFLALMQAFELSLEPHKQTDLPLSAFEYFKLICEFSDDRVIKHYLN